MLYLTFDDLPHHQILRVIEYTAGAGGYSASGDIGPDSVSQNEAQSAFRNDPSVRAQNDVWNRAQPGNLGANTWNSQPVGWSSADPLWNVAALPKLPNYQPAQQSQFAGYSPQQQSNLENRDQKWDLKVQKSYDNSNDNKWEKSEQRGGIDWNTWNANQQTWTKQTRSGPQQWTSNVNHNWQQPSGKIHQK